MYVTGRNNTGVGTILASLAEASKRLNISKVVVCAKSESNKVIVAGAIEKINSKLSTAIDVEYEAAGDGGIDAVEKLCLKWKFDCAIVSLPDHLHYQYCVKLMELKIHCLVVKPLTPTFDEAQKLAALQKANNLHCCVEFHKRHDETNLYIKRLLLEETIGTPVYFSVDYTQRINIPEVVFKGWAEKTNIFQYLGVHYVDLIYFLTGFKPYKICAAGVKNVLLKKGIDTYDSVHATIRWRDELKNRPDFISVLTINWIDPDTTSALSDQKYRMICSGGRIDCDQKNRGLELVTPEKGIQAVNPYFSDYLYDEDEKYRFNGYGYKSVYTFLDDIRHILAGKSEPFEYEDKRPTFTQSLISTAVIDKATSSLARDFEWREIKC
jgi:predicted dehydrogenase